MIENISQLMNVYKRLKSSIYNLSKVSTRFAYNTVLTLFLDVLDEEFL